MPKVVFAPALARWLRTHPRRIGGSSTTGGLWISEDAGMNWKEVNLRLPPIHAVKWI